MHIQQTSILMIIWDPYLLLIQDMLALALVSRSKRPGGLQSLLSAIALQISLNVGDKVERLESNVHTFGGATSPYPQS